MIRFLLALFACGWATSSAQAKVQVTLAAQPITIKTSAYQARIAPDGCLTHLQLGGINHFAPGAGISRGSYFYQNGPLKLTDIERPADNVVIADSELASVRYEFADDQLTADVSNLSDADMVFFVVLNGLVNVGALDEGQLQKLPLVGQHSEASFFIDKHRLHIAGFDRLWGPWQGPHQVVETSLAPGDKKTLRFRPTASTEAERLTILQLKAAAPEKDLTITSPRNYQVIQRSNKASGRVLISGRTQTKAKTIQFRIVGEGLTERQQLWQSAIVHPSTSKFTHTIEVPAGGWYRLEAQAIADEQVLANATVEHFGVGEVFVGAGQSNSTNSGQFKTQQTSGMVSSFSGTHWQIADDPQPGVADRTQGGSFWPAFGDKMYEALGVPIGVATTGYGGTSVNQWQPDGDLFQRWLLARIHQLGPQGFRAVLWHQGESDIKMPSDEYFAKLQNTIRASIAQAGWEFPWFVAQASYHNAENPRYENIRRAQQRLWDEGIAEPGPDTDQLGGDHRDYDGKGIHFSPKGLKTHGEMWAEKLIPYVRAKLSTQSESNLLP